MKSKVITKYAEIKIEPVAKWEGSARYAQITDEVLDAYVDWDPFRRVGDVIRFCGMWVRLADYRPYNGMWTVERAPGKDTH